MKHPTRADPRPRLDREVVHVIDGAERHPPVVPEAAAPDEVMLGAAGALLNVLRRAQSSQAPQPSRLEGRIHGPVRARPGKWKIG